VFGCKGTAREAKAADIEQFFLDAIVAKSGQSILAKDPKLANEVFRPIDGMCLSTTSSVNVPLPQAGNLNPTSKNLANALLNGQSNTTNKIGDSLGLW